MPADQDFQLLHLPPITLDLEPGTVVALDALLGAMTGSMLVNAPPVGTIRITEHQHRILRVEQDISDRRFAFWFLASGPSGAGRVTFRPIVAWQVDVLSPRRNTVPMPRGVAEDRIDAFRDAIRKLARDAIPNIEP